ncbi:protein-glutamate O-methyltransferase CheR [Pseudokineococcus basanitobsidens]|uniref:protein-glutamate O-methyltransferase n=1 Tax=Pseudokineococcus basanitobsidens TaxID=1926649 RepID=A0ABU8RG28_9ACTN
MSPAGLPPADLAWVRGLVHAETAVVLDASKEYLVLSRLAPLARRRGLPDVAAYVAAVRAGPAQGRWDLVEAMTTNETSWFRDVDPFTHLERVTLPALAAARPPGAALRVWSAACSTGQEPYSVAMLLVDAPALAGRRVEVLASDVDRTALGRTRDGSYSALEVARGLPPALRDRHLERCGDRWRVRERVRSLVRCAEVNLARPLPALGTFDVVLCRNVLIYLDAATRRRVLAGVHDLLAPDGLLVLGAAETTLGVSGSWARVEGGRAALFRPLPGAGARDPGAAVPAPRGRTGRAGGPTTGGPARAARGGGVS